MGGGFVPRPSSAWPLLPLSDRDRLDAFLARLDGMTSEERIRASRYSFNRWERQIWAQHYPEEVPLVNGEVEWITMRQVDLD